jgi:hypothetical protein
MEEFCDLPADKLLIFLGYLCRWGRQLLSDCHGPPERVLALMPQIGGVLLMLARASRRIRRIGQTVDDPTTLRDRRALRTLRDVR